MYIKCLCFQAEVSDVVDVILAAVVVVVVVLLGQPLDGGCGSDLVELLCTCKVVSDYVFVQKAIVVTIAFIGM
jgi:hypothetical protein